MIAMDVDVCYKSIEIFLVLVWIKNSTSTANTVASTATPKLVNLVSAIVLDLNLILSDLNDLDESIGFIETLNRPIGTLFGPRNRARSCASFAKSNLRLGVQMNKSTPKQ